MVTAGADTDEPMRQARRNHLLALAFSFEDGFEIVFFGNRNHAIDKF